MKYFELKEYGRPDPQLSDDYTVFTKLYDFDLTRKQVLKYVLWDALYRKITGEKKEKKVNAKEAVEDDLMGEEA